MELCSPQFVSKAEFSGIRELHLEWKMYPLDGGSPGSRLSSILVVSRVYMLIQPFLRFSESFYKYIPFLKYLEIVMSLPTLWTLAAFALAALATLRSLCEWAQAGGWEAMWNKTKDWWQIASTPHGHEAILHHLAASKLATWPQRHERAE